MCSVRYCKTVFTSIPQVFSALKESLIFKIIICYISRILVQLSGSGVWKCKPSSSRALGNGFTTMYLVLCPSIFFKLTGTGNSAMFKRGGYIASYGF